MREILFRGKHDPKYGEDWCFGVPYIDCDGDCILADEGGKMIVVPETVGQYTGLTDRNGKKIFEGDIVTGYFNHEKIIGYIIYGSDATFFIQRDGLYGIGLNNATDWLSVIGNIHDSPELLETD